MKRLGRNVAVIAGTVLMASAAAPLLIPIRPLEGTVPPEDLADPESRFVDIGGLRIHCKFLGRGDRTLVLLHGNLSSLSTWNDVTGRLSQERRILVFDRPGCGLTSRPASGEWKGASLYSWTEQASIVPALMSHFGIDRATVVGCSTGAAVAVIAAKRFAERVEGLVLVSPTVGDRGVARWKRLLMATPQMKRFGPVFLRLNVEVELERYFRMAWHDPDRISPARWDEYRRLFRVDDWDRGLWESARQLRSFETECPPRDVRAPVLVVAGEYDRVAEMEETVRYAARIPQANLAVIPGCGHLPQEESPQFFVDALEEFLSL